MYGLSHSITFSQILALDLGKFNSVACIYEPASAQHRFVSLGTRPQTIHDLLVKHVGDDPADTLVVFETCDCSGWTSPRPWALPWRWPIPATRPGAGNGSNARPIGTMP